MNTKDIINKYAPTPENLLFILHDLQNAHPQNYLTETAIKETAKALGLSYSQVYSVAKFYSMFSVKPRGKHIIRVCVSPPCHISGANSIVKILEEELGIKEGETTSDNLFTLETTSCLGVCDIAPAMMIDDEVYGNLTRERIKAIISDIKSREEG